MQSGDRDLQVDGTGGEGLCTPEHKNRVAVCSTVHECKTSSVLCRSTTSSRNFFVLEGLQAIWPVMLRCL